MIEFGKKLLVEILKKFNISEENKCTVQIVVKNLLNEKFFRFPLFLQEKRK
jgi:hypothetical protein